MHFLFVCKKLKEVRKEKLKPMWKGVPELKKSSSSEKTRGLLHKDRIAEFGAAVACLYQKRQDIMYK